MPFDSAPSFKPQEQPKVQNARETAAPAPKPSGEAFARARKSMDTFLSIVATSRALSDNQKTLLETLRNDPRPERLDEVVWTDEATGVGHTFREYFAADGVSEQTLQAAERVLAGWKEAFEAENAETAPHRAEWAKYNADSGMAQKMEAARVAMSEGRAFQAVGYDQRREQFKSDWQAHTARTQDHIDRIKAELEKPFTLPILPGQPGYEEQRARSRQEVQRDIQPASRGLWADRMPRAETAPPLDPAAYASPEERTVVMPVSQQPPAPVSRFAKAKNFFKKFFS